MCLLDRAFCLTLPCFHNIELFTYKYLQILPLNNSLLEFMIYVACSDKQIYHKKPVITTTCLKSFFVMKYFSFLTIPAKQVLVYTS